MERRLNVALIGCGSFARCMHIPNLKNNGKYRIFSAMDISETAAREVAEDTGAKYWTTNVEQVFSDKDVDVVFITTRHDSHAELTIRAAQAGKHILCEKPMGLSREECRMVAQTIQKAGVKYTVGYNRGMAPLVLKAKNLLADVTAKRLIYHRIQAPFPENSWTHDPKVGGGRFVGEGCHIFDLLCELVPAPPVSIYASGGTFLDPAKVKVADSGIITITFADGSVGTTLIASAGCGSFPKESTEIYCNGKAIWISDFKEMEYCGFEGQDRIKYLLDKTDKGQSLEIDQLADAILSGGDAPNGLVKAARAAVISYMVSESIASGKPIAISKKDFEF